MSETADTDVHVTTVTKPGFAPLIPTMPAASAVGEGTRVAKAVTRGAGRTNVPLMFGEAILNFGKALVVSEPEVIDLGESGPIAGALRKQGLERARAGQTWVRRSAEYATSVAAGGFAPAPVVGYVYGGGTKDKSVSLTSVRLERPEKSVPPSSVPGTAKSALALKAGESISMTRDGTTRLFGGNLKTWLDKSAPDGTWFAGGPIGAELALEHRGKATTEILRGEGNEVHVRIYADGDKGAGVSAGPHIGVYLSGAGTIAYEVARRLRGAEKTAAEMAKMPVWREHTSGAFVDVNGNKGRDCLAELVLDLTKPTARRAYAAAVRGDLDVARGGVDADGSGVDVPVSLSTERTRKAVGLSLGLAGLGVSWEKATDKHRTRVWADGEPLTQERTVETKTRAATGATLRRTTRTSWLDRLTNAHADDGQLPKGVDARRVAVGWTRETTDALTSKSELLEEVAFAEAILGDAKGEALQAYRETVAALPESRFVKIGPRNEGGSTTATMRMRFARGAPKALAKISSDQVFATWVDIVTREEGAAPKWASAQARAQLDAESSDGKLEWKELSPSYLLERQDYFEARQLARSIGALGDGDEAARNRALRDFVGVSADRKSRLELLARLVGPDGISFELDIDSDKGPKGEQLDLHVRHVGKQVKAKNGLFAFLARTFGVSPADD